ncbi:IS21-like element helper ATPase IstB [Elizabethkingia anophelis]|uniref:IS21-like element helper ATPase IstB n=1 Tax=Elizabethkingia anophelis TaxID=1117645 RepID=UPI001EE6B7FC|nr:IS21-like element helper ATPase IstB [Elizabethkingia anophelis]UKY81811.1 IS21-like element helper ATPase IstB [Elizabethkingia anophelis]UKY82652.1 IS21-like element helper ATPase IstB [Elizabethkingia anophelis]UKY84529.1 IS21-like element helper ATPase IstB [Elizabethkingia anophelis]UKY84822.1 IS21-like element helper ATPase IstB [Elizabethkingia anophelis]UKY84831.1 IS21-like element helper ATPase IstB [Elizabethkingia anophelis]
MNQNHTIERLRNLRLNAMAQLHQNHLESRSILEFTTDEYLEMLIDRQWEENCNRKILALTKQAKFRQKASLVDVNFSPDRNLDKNMFVRLTNLDFMSRKENIIITGASGSGKSFLAQVIGNHACQMQLRTQFHVCAKLLNELKLNKLDGSYLKVLNRIRKIDLFIIDDFGLQAFDTMTREILLDIIDERHTTGSTIITSQVPVSAWHQLIGEGTIADAILDRIVNSSHRINLEGESQRKILMNI